MRQLVKARLDQSTCKSLVRLSVEDFTSGGRIPEERLPLRFRSVWVIISP
jgi:hypothetical protein